MWLLCRLFLQEIYLQSSTGLISLVFSFPREGISPAFTEKQITCFIFGGTRFASCTKVTGSGMQRKRATLAYSTVTQIYAAGRTIFSFFSTSSTSSRTRHLRAQGGEYSTALGEAQLLIRPRGWPISRIIHFCSIHFSASWRTDLRQLFYFERRSLVCLTVTDTLLTCQSLFKHSLYIHWTI